MREEIEENDPVLLKRKDFVLKTNGEKKSRVKPVSGDVFRVRIQSLLHLVSQG